MERKPSHEWQPVERDGKTVLNFIQPVANRVYTLRPSPSLFSVIPLQLAVLTRQVRSLSLAVSSHLKEATSSISTDQNATNAKKRRRDTEHHDPLSSPRLSSANSSAVLARDTATFHELVSVIRFLVESEAMLPWPCVVSLLSIGVKLISYGEGFDARLSTSSREALASGTVELFGIIRSRLKKTPVNDDAAASGAAAHADGGMLVPPAEARRLTLICREVAAIDALREEAVATLDSMLR